uniref:Spermatogenesis associated 22 n=1 Tax=Seriola lalandi dorsalis TaxID=1841481 RepID=A0A3B4Y800_SERLL
MWRQENQSAKPAAGCLSVPLFNQKKRNRVPLTSAPSVNEFFSHSEYLANTSAAPSHSTPSEAIIYFHFSSKTGQPSYPARQQDSRQNKYQTPSSSESAQTKPTPHTGWSQRGQQLSYRPPDATHQYPQQSRPLPPPVPPTSTPAARAVQPQNNSWKFTNSFGPLSSSFEGKMSSNQPQTTRPTQTQPAPENSLRILTAVIDGMRHWSQFKDKVPYLFEIFATLDSAVTLGRHGAKTFLIRDGKEAVQCVFYENEQELPRLIRGQVHRYVGNYDCSRDVLMCVSIRPCLPSELRNAQESIKACDAEMRALVKSLSEV